MKEKTLALKNLYKTIYKLFPQEDFPELYYTEEELEELKRDSRNIFLKDGENIEQCIFERPACT